MENIQSSPPSEPPDSRPPRNVPSGRAALIGTLLEFYDFTLYGTAAATVMGKVFFPGSSPFLATLGAIATFAAGFVIRPLSGAILGSIGDRIGRRRILTWTMLIMGAATVGVGLLPGYGTLGAAAPLLLVVLRMLQGIGAAGEYGGATLVAVEFARTERRGLLGSLPGAGASAGGLLGVLILLVMSSVTTPQQFLAWGWRIPFLLSIVLVVYGVWVRRKLPETPEYRQAEKAGTLARHPLRDLVITKPRELFAIIAITTAMSGFGYAFAVFVPSYAGEYIGYSQSTIYAATIGSMLAGAVFTPIFGALSRRVGLRTVLVFGLVLGAAFAFPFFYLLHATWPPGLFIAMIVGNGIGASAIVAASGTWITELLDPGFRYSALGFGRETGDMIGGAVVPLLAVQLVHLGGTWSVSTLLVALSVFGAIGLLVVRGRSSRASVPEVRAPSSAVG